MDMQLSSMTVLLLYNYYTCHQNWSIEVLVWTTLQIQPELYKQESMSQDSEQEPKVETVNNKEADIK